MVNITQQTSNSLTPGDTALGGPSYTAGKKIGYTGSFGATEAETTVAIVPITPFRQFLLSIVGSAWGSATVTIRIYPCDSGGNSTSAFFAVAVSANGTQIVYAAEMGGTTTGATYPPAAQTSGVIIGPLGSFLKITEQSAFTSGTNTVTLEFDFKG